MTFLFTFLALKMVAQDITGFDCLKNLEHIDGMEVMTVAEKMPEYKGGLEEYLRLIMKNFRYPQNQIEFQASVHVGFVIDTLGHVRNECVIRRFSDSEITPLENEVLRLVRQFQDWKPGEQNGKKIPVRYFLPVKL